VARKERELRDGSKGGKGSKGKKMRLREGVKASDEG
jgi:hypothetical protein